MLRCLGSRVKVKKKIIWELCFCFDGKEKYVGFGHSDSMSYTYLLSFKGIGLKCFIYINLVKVFLLSRKQEENLETRIIK